MNANTTITLAGGAINTSGGAGGASGGVAGAGTDVSFGKAVNLTGGETITTGGANISFASTVDGGSALGLDAGNTGNITFTGLVGNTTRTGTISIANAKDVTTHGVRAAGFVQTTGQDTTTLNAGTIAGNATVADTNGVSGISITTNTIAIVGSGNLTATGTGGVTLAATVGGGNDLTIAAGTPIVADGAVNLTGNNLTVNGPITTDTAAGTVTLNAASGALTVASTGGINAQGAVNLPATQST